MSGSGNGKLELEERGVERSDGSWGRSTCYRCISGVVRGVIYAWSRNKTAIRHIMGYYYVVLHGAESDERGLLVSG